MRRRRRRPDPARALPWGLAGVAVMRLSAVALDGPWMLLAIGAAAIVSMLMMVRALTRRA